MSQSMTGSAPIRLLVVDDEPDLELLIRQKFRKEIRSGELAFSFARDGKEALEHLEDDDDVEIVLSDIRMPRMDGLTLLDHIRDLDGILKVVMVSAFGDMENIRVAMNRGAFDFITKPIDFQDLRTTIRKTYDEVSVLRQSIELKEKMTAMERELEVASRIQLSVVPSNFPAFPDRTEIDLHATMIPAQEVGGDFYDFFWIDDHRIGLVVGDVSGKGIGAALFMAIAKTVIRAAGLEGRSVAEVLKYANRSLYSEVMRHMFVTALYVVLDVRSGEYACSNAGHYAPIRIRADEVAPIERKGGPILCALPEFEYEFNTGVLEPSDVFFLFTDGVTEAMDVGGEQYGEERLHETLREVSGQSMAELLRHVLRSISGFTGVRRQSDDITLLGLRYHGPAAGA